MPTFKDRENAFENQFAYDQETRFKISAKANRRLGRWAAELLGKTGDEIGDYAKEVIRADMEEAGHEDVIRKVVADLGDKSTEEEVRKKLQRFTAKAIEVVTGKTEES